MVVADPCRRRPPRRCKASYRPTCPAAPANGSPFGVILVVSPENLPDGRAFRHAQRRNEWHGRPFTAVDNHPGQLADPLEALIGGFLLWRLSVTHRRVLLFNDDGPTLRPSRESVNSTPSAADFQAEGLALRVSSRIF